MCLCVCVCVCVCGLVGGLVCVCVCDVGCAQIQQLGGLFHHPSNAPQGSNIEQWSPHRCADWLRYEVNVPEHAPAFIRAAIDGRQLLRIEQSRCDRPADRGQSEN